MIVTISTNSLNYWHPAGATSEEGNSIMHVAQNWRLRGTRYAMKSERCNNCGTVLLANRGVCPRCAETDAASRQAHYRFETVDRTFATIGPDSSVNIQFELRQAAR